MSLQVNDPRSRNRSKSRERSRSRDSRQPSPGPSRTREPIEIAPTTPASSSRGRDRGGKDRERDRDRSRGRTYSSEEEAEIERQYKLISERRQRDSATAAGSSGAEDSRNVISRAPRSPALYDVNRTGSDSDSKRRQRERESEKSRRRTEDRYEHSASEDDRLAPRDRNQDRDRKSDREYTSRSHSRRPSSPPRSTTGASRRDRDESSDDDSVDDELAYGDAPGSHPSYARPGRFDYAQPAQFLHAQPGAPAPRQPGPAPTYPGAGNIDWASVPECERPGFVPPVSQAEASTASMPGAFPPASSSGYANGSGSTPAPVLPTPQYVNPAASMYSTSSAGYAPAQYTTAAPAGDAAYPPTSSGYANPGQYQYAQVDPRVRYSSKSEPKSGYTASAQEQFSRTGQSHAQASQPAYQPQAHGEQPYRYNMEPQFVEIAPGGRSAARPHGASVSSANNLAVAGAGVAHGAHPPASPLLEPYRGTYQSISPMPSPIVVPSIRDEDISDIEGLDGGNSASDSGRHRRHRSKSSVSEKDARTRSSKDTKEKERDDRKDDKRRTRPTTGHDRHDSSSSIPSAANMVLISPTSDRKRVSFYDAGADAIAMQNALNHTRNIDNKPIIQILPRLTSDEILLLRQEYKTRVRMHGKGINLAKHLRLKLGTSSFGKVAYATALGRWESEAYWANCYYQAGTSRRELLIESLMGRSNSAIREIKSCFRDTRYENSLERCMRSELRADKFRVAILLALEGRRQSDREPLDPRLIRDDVEDLYRALVSREGGETAMIQIIVLRSDEHLREVLRIYESTYRHNFAKGMIAKSRNLVGETLAHILNGAINRPMRDALLLHQALRESRSGRERSELLISRLVRLHWEPRHLEQVKVEYRRRYGERLEEAIAEEILALQGGQDWGEFCIELARSA